MKQSKVQLLVSGYSTPDEPDIELLSLSDQGEFTVSDAHIYGNNPSYLCGDTEKFYACDELEPLAGVAAFEIKNDKITFLYANAFPGSLACHISSLADSLMISNYGDGTITEIEKATGEILHTLCLLEDPRKETRAHCSVVNPENTFLYTANLGQDAIFIFPIRNGRPQFKERSIFHLPDGEGPRQVLFDVERNCCYILCELGAKIHVCTCDEKTGALTLCHSYRTTHSTVKCQTGGAALLPDGTVFIANRGPNTITVFRPLPDAALEFQYETDCGGNWPRHLCAIPEQNRILVANQNSGTITCFNILQDSLSFCSETPLHGASFVMALPDSQ
ncbi:MAG: beta-propeller fold lactonase family protein [Oscillospiraceae bacterium]